MTYIPITKERTNTGYIPIGQTLETKPIPKASYLVGFQPTGFVAEQEERERKLLNLGIGLGETKTTTSQITEADTITPVLKTIKMVQEEIARSGASLALTYQNIARVATGQKTVDQIDISGKGLENKLLRTIFGDRPLESLGFRMARGEITVDKMIQDNPNIPDDLKVALKGQEKIIAPLAIGAIVVLDFTGLGGATKGLKALSVADNIIDVSKILKRIGVVDDLITDFAPRIAKLKNVDEIKGVINHIDDIQKTTKVASDVAPVAPKGVSKAITAEKGILPQKTLYHGTTEKFDVFNVGKNKEGVFLTSNKDLAERYTYTFTGKTGEVKEVFADIKNPYIVDLAKGDKLIDGSRMKTKLFAEKNGYDSLTIKLKDGTDEIIVFNPENVKVSKKGIELAEVKRFKEVGEATEIAGKTKFKVAGQYIPRDTDILAIKARNEVKLNLASAENIAKTRTDDVGVATASELLKHYNDEAIKSTSQAVKTAMYDKAGELAHITAKNLTEQGKAIQAASILGRLTPEGMLRFAAKEINRYNEVIERGILGTGKNILRKKIPQLTVSQSSDILTESKRIQNMPDGIDKAMAFKKLTDKISDIIPSTLMDKLIAVWRAGLLTGVKTSGLNTLSNLFHGFSEVVKDVPAVAVDSVASLFSKKRTIGLTGIKFKQGTQEGFDKGWRYLKTGFDERNVGAKLDYRRVKFGNNKFAQSAQTYEETIFRLMGAEDQPFYYGAKARSIQSQAIAQAKNKGLRGVEAKKFIDNLVENPTDNMLNYAVADGEIAVFQNKTTLGNIAKGIQNIGGGAGMIVVPFGRTPASVANQFINYSPVGIVKAIVQNIGKGRFDQRMFAQAMGRGLTGTGIMFLGAELYKKGMVNVEFPDNEKERELWKAEGRIPNSIKIGDKYRNVNVLGPGGFTLLAGAEFQRVLDETGSLAEAMSQSTLAGIKSLKDQTFLQGVNQLMEALSDPERFLTGWLSSFIASTIPTLFSDLTRAFDEVDRRTEGFFDKIKSRIPGLRQTLEPKIDILGREKARPGNIAETIADPSRPSTDLSTEVTEELRRLFDIGYKATPSMLGDRKGYPALTPEQNTILWKNSGEIINNKLGNLFNSEKYKKLANDLKADTISDFVDEAHTIARAKMALDLTEGLSGQELKNKLSELKEGKLLTRTVYNRYIEFSESGVELELKDAPENVPQVSENEEIKESSVIDTIVLYAKAIGTDPFTAFNRIFTGQKIRRIDAGTIIVERITESEKKLFGSDTDMQIDHIIPLQLGGSNNKDNLELVSVEQHTIYTRVGNTLGRMLRSGTITKKRALELFKDFRSGKISEEEINQVI